jgi:hypothetical protein
MRKRSERLAVFPSFDVAQRAKGSDESLSRARRATAGALAKGNGHAGPARMPSSELRLLIRSRLGEVSGDEAWVRSIPGVPFVAVALERLKRLPLGPRDGFLLSQIDGATDVDTLVEVSAMPRSETLRLLHDLFESGVVAFR